MFRRVFLAAVSSILLAAPLMAQDVQNVLVLEVTGKANGTVEIELMADTAPNHTARIKELTRAGAYDDVAFHRVIEGFMAQTGDVAYGKRDVFSEGRAGFGGSELPDVGAEFSDEPYVEGIVGMARSQDPNSANSQFFIMFTEYPSLNGQYTVVGKVISGMDVVHDIQLGAGQSGAVADPDYIASAYIKSDR